MSIVFKVVKIITEESYNMKKIKSFREYIEKQELEEDRKTANIKKIALLKKRSDSDADSASETIDNDNTSDPTPEKNDNKENQEQADSTQKIDNDNKTEKTNKPADNDNGFVVCKPDVDFLALKGNNFKEKEDLLELQISRLRYSFENLTNIINAKRLIVKTENSLKDKGILGSTPLNITHSKTFESIKSNWEDNWNKYIEKFRANKKAADSITKMMSGSLKSRRKSAEEFSDAMKKSNERSEVDSENIEEAFDILKRGFKTLSRPFTTTAELSSGIKNKFNATNVLTQAQKKVGGVYGIDNTEANNFADQMLKKYISDADAIIQKNSSIGLRYLNSAEKKLKKFKDIRRYIKDISDNAYLGNISSDIYRAYAHLQYIGTNLENLMNNYNNSLEKLNKEIEAQNRKQIDILGSKNAEKAIGRYQEDEAKRKENLEKINVATSKVKTGLSNLVSSSTGKISDYREERRKIEDEQKETYENVKAEFISYLNKNRLEAKTLNDLLAEIDNLNKTRISKDRRLDKAKALYIVFTKLDKINSEIKSRTLLPKIKEKIFSKGYKESLKAFDNCEDDYTALLDTLKEKIESDKKAIENSSVNGKSNGKKPDTAQNQSSTAAVNFAKDFDSEPKTIYAYAVQKAKQQQN